MADSRFVSRPSLHFFALSKNHERHTYARLSGLCPCLGGTDILSLFIGPNPTLPVYRGQLQARCLGMAVEAWNEQGNSSRYSPTFLLSPSL